MTPEMMFDAKMRRFGGRLDTSMLDPPEMGFYLEQIRERLAAPMDQRKVAIMNLAELLVLAHELGHHTAGHVVIDGLPFLEVSGAFNG